MKLWPLVLALAIGVSTSAAAQVNRDLRDWQVVCDNLRACSAFGFPPSDTVEQAAYLRLDRERHGAPRISIGLVPTAGEPTAPQTWTLSIDGRPVAGLAPLQASPTSHGRLLARVPPARTAALIAAMRAGRRLGFTAGGAAVEISLEGAAASLLLVDEQQRLAPRPARVRLAPPDAEIDAPHTLPAGVRPLISGCEVYADTQPPVIARLTGGQAFYAWYCGGSDVSPAYRMALADLRGQGARELVLPHPRGIAPQYENGVLELYNPLYNLSDRLLEGDGFQDQTRTCGLFHSWGWTGRAFLPVRVTVMERCHGVPEEEWPPAYTAQVR
jgi:hypothetical protein